MAITKITLDDPIGYEFPVNEGDTIEFSVTQQSTTVSFGSPEAFSVPSPFTVNPGNPVSCTFTASAPAAYLVHSSHGSNTAVDLGHVFRQPTLILLPLTVAPPPPPNPVVVGSSGHSPIDPDVVK